MLAGDFFDRAMAPLKRVLARWGWGAAWGAGVGVTGVWGCPELDGIEGRRQGSSGWASVERQGVKLSQMFLGAGECCLSGLSFRDKALPQRRLWRRTYALPFMGSRAKSSTCNSVAPNQSPTFHPQTLNPKS